MHRALAETVALFQAGLRSCNRAEDRSVVAKYLSELAPVLAAAVLGESVLGRLDAIERLFGHTWLVDETPFAPALEKWREFRAEYERWALGAMTVNERLDALSLAEAYDQATRSGDKARVRSILEGIRVDADSIERILASIGRDARS